MIASLVSVLIYVLIVGSVLGLTLWVLREIPMPEPFGRILRVVVIVIAFLLVIVLLLGLIDRPMWVVPRA